MTMTPLNKNKVRIEVIYFEENALLRTVGERIINGEMFLERSPKSKRLCFRKAGLTTSIPLTKKMYKSLMRFALGLKVERYCDSEEEALNGKTYALLDEDMISDEDDIYYTVGGKYLNRSQNEDNLPAVVTPAPKQKAIFVVQVFQYVSKEKK